MLPRGIRNNNPLNIRRTAKDQYYLMRQSQGKSGDGESTIRVWINRGHIVFDEVSGRYCKTEAYKSKYGSKI